jgi:hypothetical protein
MVRQKIWGYYKYAGEERRARERLAKLTTPAEVLATYAGT